MNDTHSEQTPATPFEDSFDYLETHFGALAETPAFPDRIAASLAAGISLPFEAFVRRHGIDPDEKLVLLALLKVAHDPESKGGIPIAGLLKSLGAESLARRHEILTILEASGTLRSLGAVQCYPSASNDSRTYRLAPWLVGPLTTGEGSEEGLPEIEVDPYVAFEDARWDAGKILEALGFNTSNPVQIWQAPATGRPGWDHMALRRFRLATRLEAHVRSESSPIGAEIRRLGLEGDERLAWFLLLHDAQSDPVGVPVPTLLRFTGSYADPAAAAERLIGDGSKLEASGGLRTNRTDGTVGTILARMAWLSRDASERVIPWPRDAFAVRPGEDGEPTAVSNRRVGFGFAPGSPEDLAAVICRPGGAA